MWFPIVVRWFSYISALLNAKTITETYRNTCKLDLMKLRLLTPFSQEQSWPIHIRTHTEQEATYSTTQSRKFIYHNQNFNTLYWRFDLITRSSSEEAGTQFFRVLMWQLIFASKLGRTEYQKRQNKVLKFWMWYMNFLLRIVIRTKWIYFSISRYWTV